MTDDTRIAVLERRVHTLTQRVVALESVGVAAARAHPAAPATSGVGPAVVPPGYWAPSSPAPTPNLPQGVGHRHPGPGTAHAAERSRAGTAISPSRLLASAGGLILLLGIGYLVRFAVAAGWLGPQVRIGLALVASAAIGGVGLRLERDPKTRTVGQICTVTGVAGAYTAIVAATVAYRLLPEPAGLALAAAVAAAAVIRGVWARGQWIAALGVVGALAAPAIVNAVSAGITLGLLVVLLAGGLWVAVRHDWPVISGLAFLVVTPQLWTVADGTAGPTVALALIAVCGGLFLAACAGHTRSTSVARAVAPILLAVNAVSVAAAGWFVLVDSPRATVSPGWWLAGVAVVHLVAAAASTRMAAVGPVAVTSVVAGFSAADAALLLLSDGYTVQVGFLLLAAVVLGVSKLRPELPRLGRAGLVVQLTVIAAHALSVALTIPAAGSGEAVLVVAAFSAAAVALAVGSRHLGFDLAVLAGVVPLALAAVRLLSEEAPLQALLDGPDDLAATLGMVLALAIAMAVLGRVLHRRFWVAAVAVANYGVSLAAVAMDPDGVGRVALTGLWAAGGAVALIGGRLHTRPDLRRAGAALLAAALSKALLVDTVTLDGTNRAVALLLCGSVLLTTAVVEARAAATVPPTSPVAQ